MTERAPSPRNGPHFGMIPHWLARLELSGREFRVLTVIASRWGKPSSGPSLDGVVETRIVRIGTHRIANETNIARRTGARSKPPDGDTWPGGK